MAETAETADFAETSRRNTGTLPVTIYGVALTYRNDAAILTRVVMLNLPGHVPLKSKAAAVAEARAGKEGDAAAPAGFTFFSGEAAYLALRYADGRNPL